MKHPFYRAFHCLNDSEVKVIDFLISGKKDITLSDFSKEIGKDVSNTQKRLVLMERDGLLVLTRSKKGTYNTIVSIELARDWKKSVFELAKKRGAF